jgi:hypothetical protein
LLAFRSNTRRVILTHHRTSVPMER